MKYLKKFGEDYLKENDGGGVSVATLGNTGGMGNVVAPQPSSTPGDVAGSTKGSGDLPAYDMGNRFDFIKRKKKKKKKKKKLDLGEDYRNMYITKFSDWNYPEKKSNEGLKQLKNQKIPKSVYKGIVNKTYEKLKLMLDSGDMNYQAEYEEKYDNDLCSHIAIRIITIYKDGKRIVIKSYSKKYGIFLFFDSRFEFLIYAINDEDNEMEEDDDVENLISKIDINFYDRKLYNVIKELTKNRYEYDKNIKKRNDIDIYSGTINEKLNDKKYYKVVTKDLRSLGLRNNPTIMKFPIGRWIYEPNPQEGDGGWGGTGGIWTAQTLYGARGLKKYMDKKAIKENDNSLKGCRLFEVEIGKILYQNTYRLKTDKVKLIREVL